MREPNATRLSPIEALRHQRPKGAHALLTIAGSMVDVICRWRLVRRGSSANLFSAATHGRQGASHLAELFRLADALLRDPEFAITRMRRVLAVPGVDP